MKKLSILNKLFLSSALTLGTLMSPLHASQSDTGAGNDPSQRINAPHLPIASTSSNTGRKRPFEASAKEETSESHQKKQKTDDPLPSSSLNDSVIDYTFFQSPEDEQIVWSFERKKALIDRVNTGQDLQALENFSKAYMRGIFVNDDLVQITVKKIPDEILAKRDDITAVCLFLALNTTQKTSFFKKLNNMKATNSMALALVAICYERGIGVEKNLEKAFELLKEAAEKGNSRALCSLGFNYARGTGGAERNPNKAFECYLSAAQQGYVVAQHNLGVSCLNGQGVEEDPEEAVKWFTLAAEQGFARSQHNLGCCHGEGQGVTKNFEEAVKWYTRAAHQGCAEAQYNLGLYYLEGLGVEENPEEALKWVTLAAEQGYARAQAILGSFYERGKGVERNLKEAVKWYTKAAEQGDSSGRDNLKKFVHLDNAAVEENAIPEQETIDHLKGFIRDVLDNTTYWIALSGDHDLPDSFGPMPLLREKAEKLECLYKGMSELPLLLIDPDFAVTCLTTQNQELKDSLLKIQDVPYLSFNSAYEDFSKNDGEKSQEALSIIDHLLALSKKVQDILGNKDLMKSRETLRAGLIGLRLGNEEMAQFVTPFFQRYFDTKEEAQEKEALTRISEFLGSFQESLEAQKNLLTRLEVRDDLDDPSTAKHYSFKEYFEILLAKTAGYRNHLFKQKYGNAFKE